MKAVDDLGRQVTVGDVASRAGLKLTQAETALQALQALVANSGGFLEVSDEGDVLYVLPKDYRSNLVSKSLRMKYKPLLEKLKALAEYAIRVSFGTALLASIAIVYTSIVVILSSGRSDDDNGGNRGGYSNQRYNSPGFSMYISPADLLCKASKGEQALVIGFGGLNLAGVVILSGLLCKIPFDFGRFCFELLWELRFRATARVTMMV